MDKNAVYPKAATEMKKDGELWRRSRVQQVKYLNTIVEQDHRVVHRPGELVSSSLIIYGFSWNKLPQPPMRAGLAPATSIDFHKAVATVS